MKKIKPKNYTKAEKLICAWTDKNNSLFHHRMVKLYVRHGMIVDRIYEITSFKQSNWLGKIHKFQDTKEKQS